MRPNVLFVTLDQFRADCLSAAGHPVVRTPQLDSPRGRGSALRPPLQPGRHRAVRVGRRCTPACTSSITVSSATARHSTPASTRSRWPPRGPDTHRRVRLHRPGDRSARGDGPRRSPATNLLRRPARFRRCTRTSPTTTDRGSSWLAELGHDVSPGPHGHARDRARIAREAHSVGAFLTDRAIAWIGEQHEPWFAHLSYLRPHPPYAAPGQWADEYDPGRRRRCRSQPAEALHRYHAARCGSRRRRHRPTPTSWPVCGPSTSG